VLCGQTGEGVSFPSPALCDHREREGRTDKQMFLVEELEQLGLGRKEDALERRVGQDPLGELPHAGVGPAVVEDEDCGRERYQL